MSDIVGAWMGTLDAGPLKLRVVFHLLDAQNGLTATMHSLDQGATGMPATAVARNGWSLKLEMAQLGGAFDGSISVDLATITGTWTQAGRSLPLVLTRVKNAAELASATKSCEALPLS